MENKEKKECACSCGCAKNKWFPHNWFCLKCIAIINIVLFYVALAFTVFQVGQLCYYAAIFEGELPWLQVIVDGSLRLISGVLIALAFLTVAKVICILKKIKMAVIKK